MCGFCGFIAPKNKDLIRRMVETMNHRGPDDEGFFLSEKICLGHRRLAVIDLSSKANQPLFNENKNLVLVCNGEIFNYKELTSELITKGHQFKSHSDNEVILHAFEQWGQNAVEKFRGFFAFALWDKHQQTLYLTRDRIGIKPLYYYQTGRDIFFASEIKAILVNKKIKREVNENAYHQYLAFQASLGQETLFKNVNKIPPATILIFKQGEISLKQYWHLKTNPEVKNLPFDDIKEKFKQLLLESLKLNLIADVPLGILLSGGLDSSTLVALMSQVVNQPIKTFAVGFGQKDDEFKYARIVAKKFNTQHQEILVKPKNIKEVLSKIVWHQDEPLADGGGIATYLAAQAVSNHVKVVLTGEGGDELFGGYSWYKLGLPIFILLPEIIKQKIYFYLTTFYKQKIPRFNQFQIFKKLFPSVNPNFLSKMIKFEIENILPNSLCMKLDKMTSAWGLEARVPFLDHRLMEFCYSLPPKYKIALNQDKILLKKIMADFLPKEILTRRKHGFLLPTEKWLNHGLKDFAKEVLLDRSSYIRNFYSQRELERLFVQQEFFREIERINLLWRLLIFELWYKIYFYDSNFTR